MFPQLQVLDSIPAIMSVVLVAIALGSNLGDRQSHLEFATARLAEFLTGLRVSAPMETRPWGVAPQPDFLNAAAVGETDLDPRPLLDRLLAIERDRGRERPHAGAPRTLDLDLILHGDRIIAEPGLAVPHPRFRERRFVVEPLASIAPDLVDPVTGLTIAELLARLGSAPGPKAQRPTTSAKATVVRRSLVITDERRRKPKA